MSEKETKKAAMLACRECGAPFAKPKQIEWVRKRVDLSEALAETCPRCRRRRFLRQTEAKLLRGEGASDA